MTGIKGTSGRRRRLVPFFPLICCFAAIASAMLVIIAKGAGSEYNQLVGILGILTIGTAVVSLRICYGSYLNLLSMFELSYYLLTTGQSFLYALGIPINIATLDLYWSDSADVVNRAYIYSFLCLMLFHLGVYVVARRAVLVDDAEQGADCKDRREIEIQTKAMLYVGWLVVAVSLVPFLFQSFSLLAAYAASGYNAAYLSISGSTSWSKLFTFASDYFIYGLMLLLVAYSDGGGRTLPTALFLLIILLNLSMGNRSEPICYAMVLAWYYRNTSGNQWDRATMTTVMALSVFIFVLIVPIVGQTRNSGTLSIGTIIESISGENGVLGAIQDTFVTMGWSGFPLVKTMQIIPLQQGYRYGQSYLFALLSLVPNLFGGTHISVRYAGLPKWLKNTLNMSYGPGFSMPAEAYYNFGWCGLLVMPLFGYVVARLLDESVTADKAKLFLKMGLFTVLFSVPRREMMTALRDGFYLVGFLYIAILAVQRRLKLDNRVHGQVEVEPFVREG